MSTLMYIILWRQSRDTVAMCVSVRYLLARVVGVCLCVERVYASALNVKFKVALVYICTILWKYKQSCLICEDSNIFVYHTHGHSSQ